MLTIMNISEYFSSIITLAGCFVAKAKQTFIIKYNLPFSFPEPSIHFALPFRRLKRKKRLESAQGRHESNTTY